MCFKSKFITLHMCPRDSNLIISCHDELGMIETLAEECHKNNSTCISLCGSQMCVHYGKCITQRVQLERQILVLHMYLCICFCRDILAF